MGVLVNGMIYFPIRMSILFKNQKIIGEFQIVKNSYFILFSLM